MARFLAFAIPLLLVLAVEAEAQGSRPWLALSGSYNTYDMSEVNEDIREFNRLFDLSMDDITSSFGFGAAIGVDLSPAFVAGLGYELLPATTHINAGGFAYEYDLAADVVVGRLAWRAPVGGSIQPGIGVGVGVAFVSGEIGEAAGVSFPAAEPGVGRAGQAVILGDRVEVSGDGPYLEGYAQADARLGPRWALVPAVGYRHARIEAEQRGSEGQSNGTFDFSGLVSRVALKFFLN